MDILKYIPEVLRQCIKTYHIPENPQKPGLPLTILDGYYPMLIDGVMSVVRVFDGKLTMTNFGEPFPVTIGIGSDSYAADLIAMPTPRRIIVRFRNSSQEMVFSLRRNGKWREIGSGHRDSGYRISFGHADDHRDPSF